VGSPKSFSRKSHAFSGSIVIVGMGVCFSCHNFDFAPAKFFCPEKVRRGFHELTRIQLVKNRAIRVKNSCSGFAIFGVGLHSGHATVEADFLAGGDALYFFYGRLARFQVDALDEIRFGFA
jgi:hypothetical protein